MIATRQAIRLQFLVIQPKAPSSALPCLRIRRDVIAYIPVRQCIRLHPSHVGRTACHTLHTTHHTSHITHHTPRIRHTSSLSVCMSLSVCVCLSLYVSLSLSLCVSLSLSLCLTLFLSLSLPLSLSLARVRAQALSRSLSHACARYFGVLLSVLRSWSTVRTD